MNKLPKKLLRIKELTYQLPDDFEGTFEDALNNFRLYVRANDKNSVTVDKENEYTTSHILLQSDSDAKLCGMYGIFELIEGDYKLMNPH